MVRSTWRYPPAHSPSSVSSATLGTPTPSESASDGCPLDSWIDRIVDEDLRHDLMNARAAMIRRAYEEAWPLSRLQSLAARGNHSGRDGDGDLGINQTRHILVSADLANIQFFDNNFCEESDSFCLSRLFAEPEPPQLLQAKEVVAAPAEAAPCVKVEADFVCRAQPQSEIDINRRNRYELARSLQAALAEQKASLRSDFEKELAEQQNQLEGLFEERHESSAQLHEIEMLNLQDDHDAEVRELKQTAKDLRARLAERSNTLRTLRAELRVLRDRYSTVENQLHQKSSEHDRLLQGLQERERLLQSRNEELHELREELARTRRGRDGSLDASQGPNAHLCRSHRELTDRYNGLLTGFNHLRSDKEDTEARLRTTQDQLEAAQAALAEQEQACEDLRALHDHVVAEKVRDFSWHVAHGVNPLSMKPMLAEDQMAEATKQLREQLEEQIKLCADLQCRLEAAQAASKARFKKQKRVIANQSQEKVILEMALAIAQGQRDKWAEQYDEVAEAVTSKLAFSSFARGLAERHLALQKTRFALEVELLEAKIRGDRAVLECAIRERHEGIKLKKRDDKIAKLEFDLRIMKQKFESENGMVMLYKDVIDKEMPGLRQRNSQVERMLEDQITKNVSADHLAVYEDLHRRIHELEHTNAYWEQEMNTYLQEYGSLQTGWNIFTCSVLYDLCNARGWRNERDRVENENIALRERFADELVNEPLVIPEDRKTSTQLEDDFKLESIDDVLLEQYGLSWGAVPKKLMDREAPPWEHVKVDLDEDIAVQKKRWLEERDRLVASFKDGACGTDGMANDHEWIDSEAELEAAWKWKEAVVGSGEGEGSDGQSVRDNGPADEKEEDPEADLF